MDKNWQLGWYFGSAEHHENKLEELKKKQNNLKTSQE